MLLGRYSSCKECENEKRKKHYKENPELYSERAKRNYQKHKEKRIAKVKEYYEENSEKIIESVKEWTEENKPRAKSNWRSSMLRRKYGISLAQYEELLEKQNYCCAICNKHMDTQKGHLHVDHAHTESEFIPAGAIRGLLCWNCNLKIIGKNTNPLIFEKAANYLRQHTGWIVPSDQVKPKRKRKKRK